MAKHRRKKGSAPPKKGPNPADRFPQKVSSRHAGDYPLAMLEQTLKGLESGAIVRGRAHLVEIRHDDWCDLLNGKGPCNCIAEICPPVLVPVPEDN